MSDPEKPVLHEPQSNIAAKIEPPPSARYHLYHGLRDVAVAAGLAALAYLSSDDFAAFLEANPKFKEYAPAAILTIRAIYTIWGKVGQKRREV